MSINTKVEDIPNTFAPNSRNRMFSVDMIIHGLRFGFIQMKNLPEDVRIKVQNELDRKHKV